jgi:hypothetical protein
MAFQDVLKLLREDYGEPLTATQVAQIFGVDRRTVKKYPCHYGGVEIAPGCLRFFEKRIRGIISNANTLQNPEGCSLARCLQNRRPRGGDQNVRDGAAREAGGGSMGTGKKKGADKPPDPFGFAEYLEMVK